MATKLSRFERFFPDGKTPPADAGNARLRRLLASKNKELRELRAFAEFAYISLIVIGKGKLTQPRMRDHARLFVDSPRDPTVKKLLGKIEVPWEDTRGLRNT